MTPASYPHEESTSRVENAVGNSYFPCISGVIKVA